MLLLQLIFLMYFFPLHISFFTPKDLNAEGMQEYFSKNFICSINNMVAGRPLLFKATTGNVHRINELIDLGANPLAINPDDGSNIHSCPPLFFFWICSGNVIHSYISPPPPPIFLVLFSLLFVLFSNLLSKK